MSGILDKHVNDDGKLGFQMEKHESFAVALNTDDGFRYGVDPVRASVAFNHRIKVVPVSGSTPTLEMLSTPKPFTVILPIVCDKLVELTQTLPGASSRRIHRIGIVSETPIDEHDLPPGLARYLDYISRPWGKRPRTYTLNAMYDLADADGWADECIFTLHKPSEFEPLVTVTIDWGRKFKTGRKAFEGDMRQLTKHAQEAAITFLEEMGEGSRFDEELIRSQ